MKIHLKGLLRKELYLLKNDYIRLSFQVIILIVLGIILSTLPCLDDKVKRERKDLLREYGYTSGSNGGGSFHYREFEYGSCRNIYRDERYHIGFVNKGGQNEKRFFDKLSRVLKRNNPELSFKEFDSEDDMVDYARSANNVDGKWHILCLGISFDQVGDEYKYKLFFGSRYYHDLHFKENFYNELSLYSL